MERDIFCADLTALLRETIDDGTEQPLVVTPTASLVPPLVELATDGVADGVRLFTRREASKWFKDQVPIATRLADVVATGTDGPVRYLPAELDATLLIVPDGVVVVTQTETGVAGLVPGETLTRELTDLYESAFENAEQALFRAPPRTAMLELVSSSLGEAVADDVGAILTALEDVETVSLSEASGAFVLAGARHGSEQYRVRQTMEDVGFASQATVSRRKSKLEAAGVVETHALQTNVGRPREELALTDAFADATPTELADVLSDA
jgi:hypothetical protein